MGQSPSQSNGKILTLPMPQESLRALLSPKEQGWVLSIIQPTTSKASSNLKELKILLTQLVLIDQLESPTIKLDSRWELPELTTRAT
jgi:hypothetical protein